MDRTHKIMTTEDINKFAQEREKNITDKGVFLEAFNGQLKKDKE